MLLPLQLNLEEPCVELEYGRPIGFVSGDWLVQDYTNIDEEIFAPDESAEDGQYIYGAADNSIDGPTVVFTLAPPTQDREIIRIRLWLLCLRGGGQDYSASLEIDSVPTSFLDIDPVSYSLIDFTPGPSTYEWRTLTWDGPWNGISDVEVTIRRESTSGNLLHAFVAGAIYATYEYECVGSSSSSDWSSSISESSSSSSIE